MANYQRDERDRRSSSSSSSKQQNRSNGASKTERERRIAWTVVRNGEDEYWHQIGSSFVNADGSETVRLFANPLDGKIILRKPKPKDDPEGDGR